MEEWGRCITRGYPHLPSHKVAELLSTSLALGDLAVCHPHHHVLCSRLESLSILEIPHFFSLHVLLDGCAVVAKEEVLPKTESSDVMLHYNNLGKEEQGGVMLYSTHTHTHTNTVFLQMSVILYKVFPTTVHLSKAPCVLTSCSGFGLKLELIHSSFTASM